MSDKPLQSIRALSHNNQYISNKYIHVYIYIIYNMYIYIYIHPPSLRFLYLYHAPEYSFFILNYIVTQNIHLA